MAVARGACSRRSPRPSSNIRALVFLVLGEVTPSWSSFTSGSADTGFLLTTAPASLCPVLALSLDTEVGRGASGSDGAFCLGPGADDDGRGVREELGLPVESLEADVGRSPQGTGLEPPWWSEGGLGLGVRAAEGVSMLGLDTGLLLALSRSRRWLL